MYNASTRSLPHRAIASVAFAFTLATGAALPSAVHADTPDASGAAAIRSFDITFSGYAGAGALTDFPVLVRLSPALNGFDYSRCRADGSDIRFVDASGTPLAREVDTWNPGGESLVWVKVPSLTASTKITCLYGFAGAAPGTASDVWSNGYAAVWHLGESALPLADSSADPAPFSVSNCLSAAAFAAAGKLGGAVDFSQGIADASGNYYTWLAADDAECLDGFKDFTIEFWTYAVTAGKEQNYFSKFDKANAGYAYRLYQNADKTQLTLAAAADGVNAKTITKVPSPTLNAWNHIALIRNVADKKGYAYLAGELVDTTTPSSPMNTATVTNNLAPLCLGNKATNSANRCQGKIDELRISRVARSADWVKASHDCVENAAFATYTASATQTANDWGRYAKQFSVTFSGAPAAPLQDFPVLVRLSEGSPSGFSYADCLRGNGGDLRFADSGGNLLASEVDTWNTNGESLVWVKVPSLAAGTRIKAYYGWSAAPAVDGSKVWDGDYVGVWHLGEPALPLAESSGVGTPFSAQQHLADAAFASAGIAGGAVDFTATNNIRPYLQAASDADLGGLGSFTVECWTKRAQGANGNRYVLSRNNGAGTYSFEVFQTGSGNIGVCNASTNGVVTIGADKGGFYVVEGKNEGTVLGYNDWYHQAYVRDVSAGCGYGYVNGTLKRTQEQVATGALYSGDAPLLLGNRATFNASNCYNGLVDEVRISRVARSAAWVKAAHDTVADNSFARYSAARANNDTFVIVVR